MFNNPPFQDHMNCLYSFISSPRAQSLSQSQLPLNSCQAVVHGICYHTDRVYENMSLLDYLMTAVLAITFGMFLFSLISSIQSRVKLQQFIVGENQDKVSYICNFMTAGRVQYITIFPLDLETCATLS